MAAEALITAPSHVQLSCDYAMACLECQSSVLASFQEMRPRGDGGGNRDRPCQFEAALLEFDSTNHSERRVADIEAAATVPIRMRCLRPLDRGFMKAKQSSVEREKLRTRIREAGLRCTAARLAVIGELHKSTSPLSHGDVAATLAPLGFDRATVYRNLVELSEAGLISRVDLGDHTWRFEWRTNDHTDADEHPHFVCTKCGGVSCLVGVEVNIRPAPGKKGSAVGQVTEVLLKGRCSRCA
jgi:Fur family ferric uptake transcriptional regulator